MTGGVRSWFHGCRLALVVGSLGLGAGPALADGWAVDRDRSRLGFQITESGNRVDGVIARWTADIVYDPANPSAARLRVRVATGSAATGERRRDEMLAGPDWLDSARAPFALFESEWFQPLGNDRFETVGTLRLRDAVRPVKLSFTLSLTEDEALVRGGTTLVRTQFGIGQGQWAGQTVVGFDVTVAFDLQATRIR